ncbi:MAG: hypothetical protein ABIL06_00860, partial [Pseudomonadota bacterium]
RQRDLRIRHWTAPEKDIHLNGHRLCLPGTCIQRQGGVLYALENFVTSFGKETLMLRPARQCLSPRIAGSTLQDVWHLPSATRPREAMAGGQSNKDRSQNAKLI